MASSLKELGERVASELEACTPERARAIESARRGFLQHELGSRRPSAGFFARRLAWASGAAVVVLVAAMLVIFRRGAPLTFAVNGAPGAAKSWLAAPDGSALWLAFSEGTKIRLEPASRAKVAEIDAQGASLALESGQVHAEVVHRTSSAWKVEAGPFTVRVTGTVFDVDWEPNSEQLTVSVSRGSVSVHDSNTGDEQTVQAPETLRSTASTRHFELARSDDSSAPLAADSAPSVAVPVASDGAESAPAPAAADSRDTASSPLANGGEPAQSKADGSSSAWRELARRGALREAFASAEAAGFGRTCASASPAELLLLGDGARLSGKAEQATLALLTLRRRYPGDPRRAAAAFALGKVAFDQRGAYEQAAAWFATSLREQPGGPLAREASGRLIEALRRADDSAGARRAARDYLDKYPEGPHADLARSVLR